MSMYTKTSVPIRGVLLIETIIHVAIFTLIMIAIVSSLRYFYRTNAFTINQAYAITSAQRGIKDTVKTLREASYGADGGYPLVAIANNEITFYADLNQDSFAERVRYYVQGTSLLRDVTTPSGDPPTYAAAQTTSVISETVRNVALATSTFIYFDSAGTEVANMNNVLGVRYIRMNIAVDVDPNRMPDPVVLRSTAALRNLR